MSALKKGDSVRIKEGAEVVSNCSCHTTAPDLNYCSCVAENTYSSDECVGIFTKKDKTRYHVIHPEFGEVWVWKEELEKIK